MYPEVDPTPCIITQNPKSNTPKIKMCSYSNKTFYFLFFFFFVVAIASAIDDHCNPSYIPDPLTLDPDRITVLISGYSPSRVPILRSLAEAYSSHPLVDRVLVLWFNPSVLPEALTSLPPSVSLHVSPSSSLNLRFLPRREIRTRSVLVSDDDVEISADSLSFAFRVWTSSPGSLVGFFARAHHLDLGSRSWIYTRSSEGRHSIVLTKLMVARTEYLRAYSCRDDVAAARRAVERERNCEDILMNFVAAMESGGARPVVVEGRKGVRDWGDPRNDAGVGEGGHGGGDVEEGLSSRGDHWRKRGECIAEFHRSIGRMPLRYGYGKVVEGDAEPGLCLKAARLVPCDAQDN